MGLVGDQITETDRCGRPVAGDSFAILLNASHEAVSFRLGARQRDVRWICLWDTAVETTAARLFAHQSCFPLEPRSLAILRAEPLPPAET
jgi:hypothetical protein